LIAAYEPNTMGRMAAYIGIDLGAESGRVIVGVLADDRLRLQEVHRFNHEPQWWPTGLHWDVTGIWREIVAGLRKAAEWGKANGVELVSVGVDTWGVDWALVDKAGELVGLPHAYRDPRNPAAYERVLAHLGKERIYQTTGIQFMPLNTLYSLYAHWQADPLMLEAADQLLFMPDLIHFWLSGNRFVEATNASTSQMVDCHTGKWARAMVAELGLPTHILGPISPPGTDIGRLRHEFVQQTGLPADMRVVAPATHDTASAVAAVPAVATGGPPVDLTQSKRATGEPPVATGEWCYLSSGTWSLLGAEIAAPCVSAAAQAASFTNELGIGGTIRFLKNIPGLWLVQECRRDFARRGENLDYSALTRLASEAAALRTIIDPAHESFATAGDMPRKIEEFATLTGQPKPATVGAFVRTCLESLAMAYREKLETLESILDRRFDVIHVVGGGGKNELLCQMTADATGRRVVVGPYEATATGNILVQALAIGDVRDIAAMRRIVVRSSQLTRYEPSGAMEWQAAYERYRVICSNS
jgi:rhamnulokinase